MASPIVGGLLAFLAGLAVAVVNYGINLSVLKKKPAALTSLSVVRQALNVGCLAAAYLLSKVLPWDSAPLLIGAALGLTVPSVLFSLRLAKQNDAMSTGKTPGEGDDQNE